MFFSSRPLSLLPPSPVHSGFHSDPVQAHHLQRLYLSRLVPGYRLRHGFVLGDLHTHLCHLQGRPVPRSHLQRGTDEAHADANVFPTSLFNL